MPRYLKDIEFDYVILDEAQAIKNAATPRPRRRGCCVAEHRLALSGTPVENHLGELWSLFEFLNPGMLGSASVFQLGAGDLRNPTQRHATLLARALGRSSCAAPRSRWRRELPAKQEQTLYCELEAPQRRLYNELRDHYRKSLLERVRERRHGRIQDARTRGAAAAAAGGLPPRADRQEQRPASRAPSWTCSCRSSRRSWRRATRHWSSPSSPVILAIVRERLDRGGIAYEYLDGQTRDRPGRSSGSRTIRTAGCS